jgi:hypothetical protein
MQNNPSPLFVKCPRCGCGNPPALKACRNCHAQVGAQSFNGQMPPVSAGKKSFRKLWLVLLILPLLFGAKYFTSYGQMTIKKRTPDPTEPQTVANPDKIAIPPDAWYKQTFKSRIWETPSTEDVLAHEIEAGGGWKALKPFKSMEINGQYYNYSCEVDAKTYNVGVPAVTNYTTLKFKAPGKYSKETTRIFPNKYRDTELIIASGKGVYRASYTDESKPKIFEKVTDSSVGLNGSFFTAAQNYAAEYYDFSDVSIRKTRDSKVVYEIKAFKDTPKGTASDSFSGESRFSFDVVTGRLTEMNGVTFMDYQKVGDVSLPHKICVYDSYGVNGWQLVIDEWILDPPIPDADFELPDVLAP